MSARLLKDPSTASSRIFVGHLQTDDMNKTDLEEHFSKYGKVVGSLINRGFGFVQFENDDAARNAITKEDGSMFKGRRIGKFSIFYHQHFENLVTTESICFTLFFISSHFEGNFSKS